ncbi:GroES-like protein [Colletotrichum somersetense]|nr:GroES-like protein [Colletotrichum somersetense]
MAELNPAFVIQSIKNVSFEDREVPKLRDEYDVRVHVEQTGICGSDLHCWQRGRISDFVLESPIVLGHESSGTVFEVGDKVKNVKKYYVVDCDYTYPIPGHMSAEDGALVEPIAVAVQICKVAGLRGGQTVLVFGCGPIGVLCQAVAKPYGAGRVNVVFPITAACIAVLNIKGSIRYTTGCYPEAVSPVASGKVQLRRLITHPYKFQEALEAFEVVRQAKEDTLKVVIQGVPK